MSVRDVSVADFLSYIGERDCGIVLYGAGVIGKVTAPFFIESNGFINRLLFIADSDTSKQGSAIRIGDRDIPVLAPACMGRIKGDYIILITASRNKGILEYLNIAGFSDIQTYILPLMLARRSRKMNGYVSVAKSDTPLIPKIIHYCWFGGGDIPPSLVKYMESWRTMCPDYEIMRWDERNFDVYKSLYTKQAYERKKWAFIPDVARLEILYEYGGIYLDTDVELIRPLDDLLYMRGFVSVEKWGVINAGGGCGAVPHHPMIRKMLDARRGVSLINPDGSINTESSGASDTMPYLEKGFKPDNTTQEIEGMTVFGSEFFHPYDYMTGEMPVTDNTYGIHHFRGSWVENDDA